MALTVPWAVKPMVSVMPYWNCPPTLLSWSPRQLSSVWPVTP
jgi:hypothetical protein